MCVRSRRTPATCSHCRHAVADAVVFVYYGHKPQTPEVMDAWRKWFASVGSNFVDSGNPFEDSREVTKAGSRDLPGDASPVTGYSIVSAETIEAAKKLLNGVPIIDSIRIYEALAM